MDISVHEIAGICTTDSILSQQLIEKIDELTHVFGSSFDVCKVSLCNETWQLIGRSIKFWQNCSLLLGQGRYDETRLQVLVLIHRRVKDNWYYEEGDIKINIKNYLCGEAQRYSMGDMTKTRQSYYRKINQIIVEVLKYQWMSSWQNFLAEICDAIFNNVSFAENYFDLLSIIFEEIFSEEEKLTSEEMKKIREEILNHYNQIGKLFEKFLSEEFSTGILKSCLEALNGLILWVPPHYLYFGQISDRLIELLENSCLKNEILMCLQSILTLPNDDDMKGFLGKIYQKKRSIILHILKNQSLHSTKQVSNKILSITLAFLQQQKKALSQYGEKSILQDSQSIMQTKAIFEKLFEWVSTCQEENQIIDVYKYLPVRSNTESITNVIQTMINITPCPSSCSYYSQKNIIKAESGDEVDGETQRQNFLQAMINIVKVVQQQYFEYIYSQLSEQFNTVFALKYLCRLIWNFYYYLEVCSQQNRIKEKVFAVLSQLIVVQDKNQKNIQCNQLVCLSGKILYCCKLGMILILSHWKCINNYAFCQPFYCNVVKAFEQDNNFIKAVIETVGKNYELVEKNYKKQINTKYIWRMHVRENHLEVDIKYIEMVGGWAIKKEENLAFGFQMVLQIVQLYRNNLLLCYNQRIGSSLNLKQAKQQVFQAGLHELQILVVVIPYFKSEILFEIQEEINIIKETTVVCDLSGEHREAVRYYQLASRVLVSLLFQLTEEQVNKNQDALFGQALEITGFILGILGKKKVSEQIVEAMLEYLGKFVYRLGKWEIDQQRGVQLISKILTGVYSCNFTHETVGFTRFVHWVLKCKKFPMLEFSVIKETLVQILVLAGNENENQTMDAIEIFKSLLNDSLDSKEWLEMLNNFILDLVTHIYMIIVRLKSSLMFVKEYSDVLFMGLVLVRNMKNKFCEGQLEDNISQLMNQMMLVTRKNYPSYSQIFLDRIQKFIIFILKIGSKQEFMEGIKDLVVLLRRGY